MLHSILIICCIIAVNGDGSSNGYTTDRETQTSYDYSNSLANGRYLDGKSSYKNIGDNIYQGGIVVGQRYSSSIGPSSPIDQPNEDSVPSNSYTGYSTSTNFDNGFTGHSSQPSYKGYTKDSNSYLSSNLKEYSDGSHSETPMYEKYTSGYYVGNNNEGGYPHGGYSTVAGDYPSSGIGVGNSGSVSSGSSSSSSINSGTGLSSSSTSGTSSNNGGSAYQLGYSGSHGAINMGEYSNAHALSHYPTNTPETSADTVRYVASAVGNGASSAPNDYTFGKHKLSGYTSPMSGHKYGSDVYTSPTSSDIRYNRGNHSPNLHSSSPLSMIFRTGGSSGSPASGYYMVKPNAYALDKTNTKYGDSKYYPGHLPTSNTAMNYFTRDQDTEYSPGSYNKGNAKIILIKENRPMSYMDRIRTTGGSYINAMSVVPSSPSSSSSTLSSSPTIGGSYKTKGNIYNRAYSSPTSSFVPGLSNSGAYAATTYNDAYVPRPHSPFSPSNGRIYS